MNKSPTHSIGISPRLTVAEFNRRAGLALKTVEFRPGSFDARFARRVGTDIRGGITSLTDEQQLTLYRVIHRHRRHIWDKLITDFAAQRIQEAD